MWAEVNGERKKVACGPCIRGHRSSKCDHRDRVLVEVRKPGRPLSSCPHPSGSCSCERVVINYTIPKTSECACPSDQVQPAVVAGTSTRVQKSRHRKSVSTFSPAVLEKAIKSNQDAETDSSSLVTRTPTSDANSPPSSASSTPRVKPAIEASAVALPDLEPTANKLQRTVSPPQAVSSCCRPKVTTPKVSSCCSGKAKEAAKPVQPAKSCCSSSKPIETIHEQQHDSAPQARTWTRFPQQSSHFPPQFQQQPFAMLPVNGGFAPTNPPHNFHTPIYNHVGSSFPQPGLAIPPMAGHVGAQPAEHNCHCGESCSCFGCAAHPNNATMMEYIRSMHQYMSTGGFGAVPPPAYDLPTYPHHAGYGAEAGLVYDSPAPNTFVAPSPVNYAARLDRSMSVASSWHQSAVHTPIQGPQLDTSYFSNTSGEVLTPIMPPEVSIPFKAEETVQSPVFADSPNDGQDEEQNTLSPSSYFWQEVVLPGCNDATGTCQCGDGCDCVGCLTHGGHNGVQLDATAASLETESYAEYGPSHEQLSHDPRQFAQFANAPI